jgi:hypothetical protein
MYNLHQKYQTLGLAKKVGFGLRYISGVRSGMERLFQIRILFDQKVPDLIRSRKDQEMDP